jgi:hypothetical protein
LNDFLICFPTEGRGHLRGGLRLDSVEVPLKDPQWLSLTFTSGESGLSLEISFDERKKDHPNKRLQHKYQQVQICHLSNKSVPSGFPFPEESEEVTTPKSKRNLSPTHFVRPNLSLSFLIAGLQIFIF